MALAVTCDPALTFGVLDVFDVVAVQTHQAVGRAESERPRRARSGPLVLRRPERRGGGAVAADHPPATHEVGVADDPLGDELWGLDVVGGRVEHAGDEQ